MSVHDVTLIALLSMSSAVACTSRVMPGCATHAGDATPFRIHATGVAAATVRLVECDLAWAEVRISDVFGTFPDTVSVHLFPHRDEFSAALREAWGIPETQCWMVGAADDHSLYLLSPDVWAGEACEHDPADDGHRRMLIAHEAVHVYHGQINPSADLGLLEDIGWFIEGLATWASGQLETDHAGRAAEALDRDVAPSRLVDAWSGPYRYGVAGSMVAFIDRRWGRPTLLALLTSESTTGILAALDTTEADFLRQWQEWVRRPPGVTAGVPMDSWPAAELI